MENNNVLTKQWKTLWISFFTIVVMYIPYVGYTTKTTDMMEELSMNYTMVGGLASITALAGGIALPFAGVLADKWGSKKVIISGLIILGVGQLLFSLAPTYEWIVVSRILIGMSVGILFVAPYTMVTRWFEQSNNIGVGIGTVVATYMFALILSVFEWRTGSSIGVLFIVAMTLIAAFYLKEHPNYTKRKVDTNKTALNNTNGNFSSLFKEYLKVITHKNVIAAGFFLVGLWGSYGIAVYWVPTILMEEKGWSAGITGFIGATYALAGVISAVFSGQITDKLGKRKPLILISGIGMALSFLGFAVALAFNQYVLLAILLPISGFFAYAGMPLCYALATDSVGVKLSASANGFIMSIGFIIGGILYPLVVGYVKDMTGTYIIGFITAALSLLVLNVLISLTFKDVKNINTTLDTNLDIVPVKN